MIALEVHDLYKTYKNGVLALKGIHLSIQQGDFFGLLGPNAAGKSTLIHIITSLIKKSLGKIFVFGQDLDKELQEIKLNIGLVPQEFNFNPSEKILSILIKQAGYYGVNTKIARERSEVYLKKFSLWHKHDVEARHLSGGQKRCLMLARALMHEPKLIILDEPTSGVDIETRRSIWGFLRELNEEGTTIILTTHYLEEAEKLCKNVAIINQGEVVAYSRIHDLLNLEELFLHLTSRENNHE
jgi:ABC-2 type transport system ATP-binding protein